MRVHNFHQNHQPAAPSSGIRWILLIVAVVLLVGAAAFLCRLPELARPLVMALTTLGLTGDVAREIQDQRPDVAIWPVGVCGLTLAGGSAVVGYYCPDVELEAAVLLGVAGVLVPLCCFLLKLR